MTQLRDLLANAAAHATAGRVDAALESYRRALKRSPAIAEAHYNVGVLLARKDEFAAAEKSLAQAAALKPAWAQAVLALGHLYFRQRRFADAEQAFQRAAMLNPQSVEAWFNLASALDRQRRWNEAIPPLRRARALAPDREEIWNVLRGHLLLFHRDDEAFADFLLFEAQAPLSTRIVTAGLLSARRAEGVGLEEKYLPLALDWNYVAGEGANASVAVVQAQYYDVPRAALLQVYQKHNSVRQQERAGADLALLRPPPAQRLKIGYLSADFRSHVMGKLMLEVLRRHDPARFVVHAYSIGVREIEDSLTDEFREVCARFVRLDDVDDLTAAKTIAADELDLLIDLMGHSGASRPAILLHKPAPVIITHLGNHGPVALEQVDFKLTDAHADLPDAADFQIETPLVLDACVLPFRRVAPSPEAPTTRAALGVAEQAIVFGAFVGLVKLSPRCLRLWRRILDEVPGSALAFAPHKESEQDVYRRRLASFDIPPERIVFIPWALDDATDRARYRLIDIVLDTMPYTGGDTTAAALDMHVPVVTRVGERQAERMTYSLLAHLGMIQTVAHTDDEYVAIACRLAQDADWRRDVSQAIADKLPQSGLADGARYVRALEAAYERATAAIASVATASGVTAHA